MGYKGVSLKDTIIAYQGIINPTHFSYELLIKNDFFRTVIYCSKNPNQTDKYGETILCSICSANINECKKIALMRLFLSHPYIKVNTPNDNYFARTALHCACIDGNKKIVKLLLARSGIDINATNSIGETPLHKACQSGFKKTVQLLLANKDILIDLADNLNKIPLDYAVKKGNLKIIELFLAKQNINIDAQEFYLTKIGFPKP
jgi:ankyrin repeat protein